MQSYRITNDQQPIRAPVPDDQQEDAAKKSERAFAVVSICLPELACVRRRVVEVDYAIDDGSTVSREVDANGVGRSPKRQVPAGLVRGIDGKIVVVRVGRFSGPASDPFAAGGEGKGDAITVPS
jgi:hypothetical protein